MKRAIIVQYFSIFNWHPKAEYKKIVEAAPFDACDILLLAWVHTRGANGVYTAVLNDWREDDPQKKPVVAGSGDADHDRIRLVVNAARAKNSNIKILISLGWGDYDARNAARTPSEFAESVAAIVKEYDLDGFDIDYESVGDAAPEAIWKLAQALRNRLDKVDSKREMIMTITADDYSVGQLDKESLNAFTYTMPMTYGHDGAGADKVVKFYHDQFGSYDRIVLGLNSEGYPDRPEREPPDDPKSFVDRLRAIKAAGIFAWRLDNDSLTLEHFPTFAVAKKLWELVNSPDVI